MSAKGAHVGQRRLLRVIRLETQRGGGCHLILHRLSLGWPRGPEQEGTGAPAKLNEPDVCWRGCDK